MRLTNSYIKNIQIPYMALITCMSIFWSFLFNLSIFGQSSFAPYSAEVQEPIEMVPVEGGAFLIGPAGDESLQAVVIVDSFWIGKHEITWEQYYQFSEEMISTLREQSLPGEEDFGITADAISLPSPPYVDMSFGMGTDGYPAISMTHYAASMFTKWLTAKTGHFYRLPTEAEWEYACRAGLDASAAADLAGEQAWYKDTSDRGYKQVGTKQPNAFGLYDMLGNVAEWTTDQFSYDYYANLKENEPVQNPWMKPSELYPRTVKGASWMDEADQVHCSKRSGSEPRWKMLDPQLPKSLWWHTSAQFLGFRVVRPLNEPTREEMEEYWPEEMQDY